MGAPGPGPQCNVERLTGKPIYAQEFRDLEYGDEPPCLWACNCCGTDLLRLPVLIIAGGLIGIEVGGMFLFTSMTLSVNLDFELHSVQRGLLVSFASLGALVGSLLVGHIADRRGRRPPVLWSLSSMALFAFLAAHAPSYRVLVALGAAMGFALGMGLVPVSVLLSETTVDSNKMTARGVSLCIGGILGFLMLVAVNFDDSTLMHLHWRALLKGLALSSAVLGAIAFLFLPESPSFLASVSNDFCAPGRLRQSKRWQWQHATSWTEGPVRLHSDVTVGTQLGLVFSNRFLPTTLYIGAGGFIAGLVQAGHQYALPQILSKESSLLNAATARMVIALFSVPMAPAAQCTAAKLSRSAAMMALAFSSCIVAISTAMLGTWPAPQPVVLELLFYMGMTMDPYRSYLGGLLFGEIGADVYPTTTAGFGASIVAVSIGVATIIAPMLFEFLLLLTGHWATFYYVMTTLLFGFMIITAVVAPDIEPYRVKIRELEGEKRGVGCAARALEANQSYGTVS